jgi:cell division protein FtsB
MSPLLAASESTASWAIGYTITVVVVLVVLALVIPILLLARRIGNQAAEVDDLLQEAVTNTASLSELNTTIDSAGRIIAGLERGRTRLGG